MNIRRAKRMEERHKTASKDCLPEEPKRKNYDITRTSACDPPRNNATNVQISVYDRIVEVNGQRASGKELVSSQVLAVVGVKRSDTVGVKSFHTDGCKAPGEISREHPRRPGSVRFTARFFC